MQEEITAFITDKGFGMCKAGFVGSGDSELCFCPLSVAQGVIVDVGLTVQSNCGILTLMEHGIVINWDEMWKI